MLPVLIVLDDFCMIFPFSRFVLAAKKKIIIRVSREFGEVYKNMAFAGFNGFPVGFCYFIKVAGVTLTAVKAGIADGLLIDML
jgi:hypothetical protein